MFALTCCENRYMASSDVRTPMKHSWLFRHEEANIDNALALLRWSRNRLIPPSIPVVLQGLLGRRLYRVLRLAARFVLKATDEFCDSVF
jgi:hypothetical protein